MLDLRWTIPVARWSALPAGATTPPEVKFIDPLVRRRLSTLSKMALKVAHDCAADLESVRLVFASRHGELRRTTSMLDDIVADQPVSPTAFSLSVLNAMTGIFGIARGDRAPATAISAGAETLGYALLEAHAQYRADPRTPVLMVYADEPADQRYGAVDHEMPAGALAILLDRDAPDRLECTAGPALAGEPAPAHATQGEALMHGLGARAAAAWQGLGRRWQWSLHAGGLQ
ncbi:beta-ketoacyl synthase chain length factor [Trinickia diaoshuihuensis]|uniref:beta-ketoacyl synthase chain length factor n=1 Tax=Trinickia diaoshuihuensis TaxID=2292265 RepID=UPI000E223C79|nr:beta-ketoacyl synthase chain length factor [Trinickia diaoshuihuensis]